MLYRLLLLLLLSGCAPYVGYTHLSDPRVDNDGYDLACAGMKSKEKLELKVAACKAARLSGTFLKIEAEYELF